jgi:hypothetical protein
LQPLVTLPEFALRIPEGINAGDEDRAVGIIVDASAEVRFEARKSWDGEDVPDIIKKVTIQVAKRAFLNKGGVVAESDSLDNYSHQTTYGNTSPSVYLTPEEKRQVRSAAGRSGVWTQGTTRSSTTWETDVPAIWGVGDETLREEVDPFQENLPGWSG